MNNLLRHLYLLSFVMLSANLFATHNRAGEIVYRHVSGLTYEVTFITYSDPLSDASKRTEIKVCWGDEGICNDNNSTSLQRTLILNINSNVQRNEWKATHTYSGAGVFKISVTDQARNAAINNITNSVSVPLYLETTLSISPFNNDFNNSPLLLNYPIDEGCVGSVFVHNPGAVDPDGDSLAYELDKSRTYNGEIADGYFLPPASNSITVDPISGDLIWDQPTQGGSFNLAMRIKEYRNGILLGYILRDIQVDVINCNNAPPRITLRENHCVTANEVLSFNVNAFDPDVESSKNRVQLTSSGIAYNGTNNATFVEPSIARDVNGTFVWIPNCDRVRVSKYNFLFKAIDNGTPNLSTYKTAYVKVNAPAPKNLRVLKQFNNAILEWDTSNCSNGMGYKIYRRIDSSGFVPDSCQTGVPPQIGYTRIATILDIYQTSFLDDNNGEGLVPGRKYCYLIIAYFEDGDVSYASNETCVLFNKVMPLMTKVSVDSTSAIDGVIDLAWSSPDTIDQALHQPPFHYLIEKGVSGSFNVIDSTVSLLDTTYTHSGVNTTLSENEYRVTLWSYGNGKRKVGSANKASQLFLNVAIGDESLTLNWTFDVPWENKSFVIFRKNLTNGLFDTIGSTNTTSFLDTFGLVNGVNYCYRVQSKGQYDSTVFKPEVINFSQEVCAIPQDIEPPCTPLFSSDYDCINGRLELSWELPASECVRSNDIMGFNIYKGSSLSEMKLFEYVSGNSSSRKLFMINAQVESLAGCYVITAVDSAQNESSTSEPICIETCPIYELTNVFTPNGDGINDLFVPLPYRYVDRVELYIYDRWGREVFYTTNPDINWSGQMDGDQDLLADGVYFYVGKVYEYRRSGIVSRELKGAVTLVDGTVKKYKN
ncbi:gliding motility-associated C-terminal domain-containing protein [bacterium]|nr:gliding motility-associated C-terminal domain-containing protein [bacterium]